MATTATEQVELHHVEPQVLGATDSSSESEWGLRRRANVNCEDDDDNDEDFDLMSVEQHFPTQEERKWSLYVALVSVVDVLVSGIILIVALCFAYRAAGVSLWCLSFQALSHLISSVLLALRFTGEWKLPLPGDEGADGLLRQRRRRFLHREQVLSESMGLVMLVSCAALMFKAARKLRFWDKWYKDHQHMDEDAAWATEFLAWYGFAMYVLQAGFRLVAARKLKRVILWHGFSSSVVSLLFLFVMGFAASYEKEWSWKAEPIAAIVLSVVTMIEAIRIVIMHLDDMNTRMRHDPKA